MSCRSIPAWVVAALVAVPAAAADDPAAPVPAGEPVLPAAPSLDDWIRVAEAKNPGLDASRLRVRAEEATVPQAGSFPDPQLSAMWFVREVETRVGPQLSRIGLRQRLPWFGKRSLAEDVARGDAFEARADLDETRLALRRDVVLAWAELAWLDRAIAIESDNLELLFDLERVVRERYRTGTSRHADLARVQLELGRADDRVRTLSDRRRPAAARLNALAHRPAAAEVPPAGPLPELPPAPAAGRVAEALAAGSPRLDAAEARVVRSEAGERLARRSRWPDWTVGVDWIVTEEAEGRVVEESGKDPFMVSVMVDLPLFRGKWDGAVREAAERAGAARRSRARLEDELAASAEDLLWAWRDAERRVDLFRRGLLPKATESFEATSAAYRTGTGGFLDLIESLRVLLELELELERALADRVGAAAELALLTGADWTQEGSR